jgi:hypothetical protein
VLVVLGVVAVMSGTAIAATTPDASDPYSGPYGGVRRSTDAFHNLDVAMAAGYETFYQCTDNEGVGGMGQHYVKGALVEDPSLDTLRPEVLVYEPRSIGYRLVAVEYVVIKEAWDKLHAKPPQLFGRTLKLIPAPNRYGLPDFYELHVWLWKSNPRGIFDDWNPTVSCRGNGDPA